MTYHIKSHLGSAACVCSPHTRTRVNFRTNHCCTFDAGRGGGARGVQEKKKKIDKRVLLTLFSRETTHTQFFFFLFFPFPSPPPT